MGFEEKRGDIMNGRGLTAQLKDKTTKNLWGLSYPIMIGQILHTLMMLVDIWFVSELIGERATAAVGVSTALMGVIRVVPFLLSAGAIALVSQYTGSNNPQGIRKVAQNAMMMALGIGSVLGAILFFNVEGALRIFGESSPGVLEEATKYLSIAFISIPFIFFNVTTKAIVEATGDTKNPVKVFLLMNGINIFLDYLFIAQMNMGVEGASLATLLSEIIGLIFMGILMFRKVLPFREIIKGIWRFHGKTCGDILKIGGFSMVQMMIRPITGLIMMRIVLGIGEIPAAAFSIGGRLFEFVFIFLKGLQIAVSVLVGQSLGKGHLQQAYKVVRKGLFLSGLNMIVFFLLYVVFGGFLMSLFTSNEELITIGVLYLRICYLGVLFVVFPIVFGGAFTGAGDTFPPMVSGIVGNVFIKIPLAYYLGSLSGLQATGVWIAIALSVVFEAAVISLWFKKKGIRPFIQHQQTLNDIKEVRS